MDNSIEIPQGIAVSMANNIVAVKGPKGEVKKEMNYPGVAISVNNGKVTVQTNDERKHEKRIINTFIAHINNMIQGVTSGFEYKLKLVYTHFPATVKVDGKKVKIENFMGERAPRVSNIITGAKVNVQKQDISVTGIDLEAVSQTAANMENATRITSRDRRIFQDGIFITQKEK